MPNKNERRGGVFYTHPMTFHGKPAINGNYNRYYSKYRYGVEHASFNYTPISPSGTFSGEAGGAPIIASPNYNSGNYSGNRGTMNFNAPQLKAYQIRLSRTKSRRITPKSFNLNAAGGSARYYAPDIREQWLAAFYAAFGRYPSTEQELQDFIQWNQGNGIYNPTPDDDDTGNTIPGVQGQWIDAFYAEFGRYPSSDKELQDYINWKMGSGVFNPTPEDDEPGSGIPTIQGQWMDAFFAEFGRYPNNDKELQDYINWKLGVGVFNPSLAPVGDIPWLMIVLMLAALMTYRAKTRKTTQKEHLQQQHKKEVTI